MIRDFRVRFNVVEHCASGCWYICGRVEERSIGWDNDVWHYIGVDGTESNYCYARREDAARACVEKYRERSDTK